MEKIKSTFVRKRGNNYNVMIEYFNDENKLKQKSIGKYSTKKEAEKHLIDLKSSINNNKYIISKNITLVDRCYKFLDDNINNLSPYTIKKRKSIIRASIEPFLEILSWVKWIFTNYSNGSIKYTLNMVEAVQKPVMRVWE